MHVVDDRLYLAGKLAERTTDWYAQDRAGSVWYFGEATAELDKSGRVTSTEGSWQAGRDGAVAGLFMPAQPKLGQTARQEYLKGEAEDHFRVVDLDEPVDTPSRARRALVTEEWTPLEPGVLDRKLYVRGLGSPPSGRSRAATTTSCSSPSRGSPEQRPVEEPRHAALVLARVRSRARPCAAPPAISHSVTGPRGARRRTRGSCRARVASRTR